MGFWEFIVIAVVGTIVLGPDKLPSALRQVVQLKRKLSQMAQGVTAEVSEQLRIHELHQNLKEAEKQGFENLSPDLQRSVDELKKAAQSVNSMAMDDQQDASSSDSDDQKLDKKSGSLLNDIGLGNTENKSADKKHD